MAELLRRLRLSYDLVTDVLPDPRTKSWPLSGRPHNGLLILVIYALFVLKWGPQWMKNRPPYNVDKLMIIHNVIQVIACSYIFYEFLTYAWLWDYKWICEPVDYSVSPKALNIASAVYHYYLTKYLDLLDTIFFVLRKKSNQVSFLHVFHHFNMVIVSWGCITYFPGGHGTFVGVINSFVHVVMYSYYLLTVVDPATKKSVWWKKHLTQLQIVQLAITCLHFVTPLVTQDCKYPRWISLTILPSDFFLLCLFVDFYIRTYIKKKKADIQKAKQGNGVEKNDSELKKPNGIDVGELNKLESSFIGIQTELRQRDVFS